MKVNKLGEHAMKVRSEDELGTSRGSVLHVDDGLLLHGDGRGGGGAGGARSSGLGRLFGHFGLSGDGETSHVSHSTGMELSHSFDVSSSSGTDSS